MKLEVANREVPNSTAANQVACQDSDLLQISEFLISNFKFTNKKIILIIKYLLTYNLF